MKIGRFARLVLMTQIMGAAMSFMARRFTASPGQTVRVVFRGIERERTRAERGMSSSTVWSAGSDRSRNTFRTFLLNPTSVDFLYWTITHGTSKERVDALDKILRIAHVACDDSRAKAAELWKALRLYTDIEEEKNIDENLRMSVSDEFRIDFSKMNRQSILGTIREKIVALCEETLTLANTALRVADAGIRHSTDVYVNLPFDDPDLAVRVFMLGKVKLQAKRCVRRAQELKSNWTAIDADVAS